MSYTCPRCGFTSHNENDERYSYCGNCHDFTGGYGYGHERHSSSSEQTKPNGTMQLRQDSEETKTKLPEVQGYGQNNYVRQLRGDGMGQENQQNLLEMRGNRMPIAKPEYAQPSVFRFYAGAIAVGMVWGITWTIAVERWLPRPYSYQALFGFAGAVFVWQGIHLWKEGKRLKIVKAALDKDWAELLAKYPEVTETELYKQSERYREKP